MLKKQTVIIAVLAVLIVILTVGYFAVVKPITEAEETTAVTEPVETDEGEHVAMGIDKILVYEYIESKNIQSVTVNNAHGRYHVYKDSKGIDQIEGFEGIAFDEESMSALMTSIGYASAMYKLDDPNELSEYGLVPVTLADGTVKRPATAEMVTKDGRRYSIVVGDKIVTGSGYYFLYEGRPDVVYVVDKTIEETVLSPVETLIKPMIITPMTQNDYFLVHDYVLAKGEDTIVHVDYIEAEERENTEFITTTFRMLYPKDLTPSATAVSSAMYKLFEASTEDDKLEVVHLGVNNESLAKYNLTNNCYSLYYKHGENENFLLISPRNPDGTYYIASSLFQQIVKGSSETFDFVTWSLFDWVEAPFFQMKIGFVTDISVESGDFSVTFDLEGEGQELVVTERGTGNKPDVTNFRQFYKTLLYACYEGECGLMREEMETYRSMDDSRAQLVLTIHTESGRELKYRFFRYSERRSYIELNGEGEFYTLQSMAEKIIADAKRVQSGEPITSTGKY
ncbi:MAG: DUF4340 domain-containing protein [Ruminococcaceae bacterium]|nr:DUF4340 domain-containing protein [Oscillospiraceae bacterium]